MYSLLFRNRWIAMGWVALTLGSTAAFVGQDGGAAQIGASADKLRLKRAALAKPAETAPIFVAPKPAPRNPKEAFSTFEAAPGSEADPRKPQVGDVFVNPVTGQRFRAVRRSEVPEGTPTTDAIPGSEPEDHR